MQKVLIVEDEKLVRSDIVYKVSRSGLHFQWIMEAASAEEALEIIEKNKPDILLTDIVMDGLSGIDLIRAANEIYPRMVSIIICGHADFHFAQEAIALNAIAYLLKPVRQEQLISALKKAALNILQRDKTAYLSVRNALLKKELRNQQQQEEIYAFLNGFQSDNAVAVSSVFPEIPRFYQIMILRLRLERKKEENSFSHTKSEYDLMRFGVRNIVDEIGGDYLHSFDHYADYRQVLVIAGSCCQSVEEAEKDLCRLAKKLHTAVVSHLQIDLQIGLSDVGKSLSVMYMEEAKQALDLRLCMQSESGGELYFYGEYRSKEEEILAEPDLKLYQKFLDSGDLGNALTIVRKILGPFYHKPMLHLRMAYVELICILARSCFKKGVSIFSFLGSECVNGQIIDQFENMEELLGNLCGIISAALNHWVGAMADTGVILGKVKAYIDHNFIHSELCTNRLSAQFCISLGYLSASYKKTYGITISKYIISRRIEYAAKLLRSTELPIQVIAENSGFNNWSYFMRVFKNYYSMTPAKYREQIAKTS